MIVGEGGELKGGGQRRPLNMACGGWASCSVVRGSQLCKNLARASRNSQIGPRVDICKKHKEGMAGVQGLIGDEWGGGA